MAYQAALVLIRTITTNVNHTDVLNYKDLKTKPDDGVTGVKRCIPTPT